MRAGSEGVGVGRGEAQAGKRGGTGFNQWTAAWDGVGGWPVLAAGSLSGWN